MDFVQDTTGAEGWKSKAPCLAYLSASPVLHPILSSYPRWSLPGPLLFSVLAPEVHQEPSALLSCPLPRARVASGLCWLKEASWSPWLHEGYFSPGKELCTCLYLLVQVEASTRGQSLEAEVSTSMSTRPHKVSICITAAELMAGYSKIQWCT